jgi:hypothetical protein
MEWITRVKRLLKLGFFVGAGTLAAVVSACSSTTTKIDTGGSGDTTVPDGGAVDSQPADARIDAAAAKDAVPPDKSPGWDIPLE